MQKTRLCTDDIVELIKVERKRQDKKWGLQHRTCLNWLARLMEEVGEASEALIEYRYDDWAIELIEGAAVAVLTLEDRMPPESLTKCKARLLNRLSAQLPAGADSSLAPKQAGAGTEGEDLG